ncbi:hypothetical protein PG999_014254 [Apiospora kogelbergensis]|uniref:Uncharacterized protein n=1 Tax=Apiospora kogelbergensis TaxID=1337665 RepID=A0AAW0Q930_9PEZI
MLGQSRVKSMQEMSADPTVHDKQGTTPLDACTEFEEEQMLWSDYRKPGLDDLDGLMFTAIPHGWAHNAVGGS